jgi:hypothetical protein
VHKFISNCYFKHVLLLKDGWLDADHLGCFKFLEASVNLFWVEAQQKCESIGGYLAEPSTTRYTCRPKQKCESIGGYLAEPSTARYI